MFGSSMLTDGIMGWNCMVVAMRFQLVSCEAHWQSQVISDTTQNSEGAAVVPKGKHKSRKAIAPMTTVHWTAKDQ